MRYSAVAIFIGTLVAFDVVADALVVGSRYRITKPIYVYAVYENVKDKRLTKKTARAYLHHSRYANRYFVAFQAEVPAGTLMTVSRVVPQSWHTPWASDRYMVELTPDAARGLDIQLSLDRGLDGDLDGLNAAIFERAQ